MRTVITFLLVMTPVLAQTRAQRLAKLHVTEETYQRMEVVGPILGIPVDRVIFTIVTPETEPNCSIERAWDLEAPATARMEFPVAVKCRNAAVPGAENIDEDWTRPGANATTAKRAVVEKAAIAVIGENVEKNDATAVAAAQEKVAPDLITWRRDPATRAIHLRTPSGTQRPARDIIRNKPPNLEMDPEKYLSPADLAAFKQRRDAR